METDYSKAAKLRKEQIFGYVREAKDLGAKTVSIQVCGQGMIASIAVEFKSHPSDDAWKPVGKCHGGLEDNAAPAAQQGVSDGEG